MTELILYTTEGGVLDAAATVKESLTVPFSQRRVARFSNHDLFEAAVVKQSLTTAEESSVVQKP